MQGRAAREREVHRRASKLRRTAARARTSGAIQNGVPMTVPRLESVEPMVAETPKSASLTMPLSERSRLLRRRGVGQIEWVSM